MNPKLNDGAITNPGEVLYPEGGPPLRVARVFKRYDDGSDSVEVGFGTDLRWFVDDSMTGLKVFNGPDEVAAHLWSKGGPGQWVWRCCTRWGGWPRTRKHSRRA